MEDTIYVIFDRIGVTGMRKTLPPLGADEYACKINLVVDDKYFKHLVPTARLELDGSTLIEPTIEQEVEPAWK